MNCITSAGTHCSACLCPHAPHPHVERRYLVVPGINSSRIHIIDTKPDPRKPQIVKVIEPETLASRTGYASPHTVHCGPDGLFFSALGTPDGGGPGGIFVMDPESFDVLGKWELDRGPQKPAYDFWWHLGFDTVITSESGTPNMVKDGVNPEILLGGGYGHKLHVWDLLKRRSEHFPKRQIDSRSAGERMLRSFDWSDSVIDKAGRTAPYHDVSVIQAHAAYGIRALFSAP